MITEVQPRGAVDHTPAGSVMFGGIDATIIADPGDEDRMPVFMDWLSLFDRMVAVLVADLDAWREDSSNDKEMKR